MMPATEEAVRQGENHPKDTGPHPWGSYRLACWVLRYRSSGPSVIRTEAPTRFKRWLLLRGFSHFEPMIQSTLASSWCYEATFDPTRGGPTNWAVMGMIVGARDYMTSVEKAERFQTEAPLHDIVHDVLHTESHPAKPRNMFYVNALSSPDFSDAVVDEYTATRALSLLGLRKRDIIARVYGVGCNAETLRQVGARYGLSYERIRQLKEVALHDLRCMLKDT